MYANHKKGGLRVSSLTHSRIKIKKNLGRFARKSFVFLLIFSLLLSQFSFLIPSVYAASSPWTQTDWSGGSGQTSWSDTTKYSSGSNVTTSTADQVTLTQTSSWYNASWAYRRKITFDNSAQAENLTNFPVLVKLTSSNINYSNTQDSGQDTRFTDSDGTTALSYEIEKWDETGTSYVWVKVPQIDSSSATDNIYMYYGNSSATDGQSATSVWNSSYVGVWHLKETGNGTSGEYKDSTTNANNGQGGGGTSSAAPTLSSSGQVNGAESFDGSDDYIAVTNSSSLQPLTGDWSVEFWMDRLGSGSGDYPQVIGSRPWNAAADKGWATAWDSTNNKICVHYADGTTGFDVNTGGTANCSSSTTTLNTWEHWVVVFDRTNSLLKYYKNGTLDASRSPSFPTGSINQTDAINMGRELGGANNRRLNAILDEIRVSNSTRSAAYIAAIYKSEADTFNTFASEEPQVATSGNLTSSIFDTEFSAGAAWGTLTYNATTPSNTSVSVKVRTSDSSSMTGATAFSSCSAITSGSDISSNSCVTDSHRYIQYQLTLANTDSVSTPTFQDVSIAFETYDATGPTLSLDSPGDNSYTNSERPAFKWKAATDAIGTISDYDLVIDNPSAGSGQVSGDFTISDIPVSRTTDYETNKYVVHYDGFSDSDTGNDYISVYTKSHSDWGSSELDGKLREGKVSWKVKATDSNSNSTETSRTLFVDRTSPKVEFTQVNSAPYSSANISTTDKTPTIYGKITDSLSGGDATQTQDENGPKIASGPKQVEIKLEKKQGTGYILHTIYTINMDKPLYTCDGKEVSDNSKQKCDKYLPFEYTPKDALDLGIYKITLTGKDKADNTSLETSFTLNITTLARITTPEEKETIEEEIKELPKEEQEKVKEELEITKPQEPSALEKTVEKVATGGKNIFDSVTTFLGNVAGGIGHGVQVAFNTIGQALAFVGEKTGEGIMAIGHGTQSLLASVGQGISNTAKSIGDGYNSLANNAPGVAKTILTGIGNGVSATGSVIASVTNTVVSTTTSLAKNTATFIGNTTHTVATATGTAIQKTSTAIASATQNTLNSAKERISGVAFKVGEKTQDVSGIAGFAIVKFGYLFVNEPTSIADVKVVKLDSTSATISWTTNHPANGKVNYGLTADYGQDLQSEKRITHHEFTITGLKPNTTYYYEVMSYNKNYVYDANHTFTTPEK